MEASLLPAVPPQRPGSQARAVARAQCTLLGRPPQCALRARGAPPPGFPGQEPASSLVEEDTSTLALSPFRAGAAVENWFGGGPSPSCSQTRCSATSLALEPQQACDLWHGCWAQGAGGGAQMPEREKSLPGGAQHLRLPELAFHVSSSVTGDQVRADVPLAPEAASRRACCQSSQNPAFLGEAPPPPGRPRVPPRGCGQSLGSCGPVNDQNTVFLLFLVLPGFLVTYSAPPVRC